MKPTEKSWERLLPLSLFLALYELAAQSSFYLLELSLVGLALCFLWEERGSLCHPLGMLRELIGLTAPCGWQFSATCAGIASPSAMRRCRRV